MSTAAAVATTEAASAPTGDPNAFTADELAVMEGKAPASATPEARQARDPAGASGEPPAQKDEQQGDDEAEIEIGGDGTVRDLKTGRFVRHEAFVRTKNELKSAKEANEKMAGEVFRTRERLAILTELSQPATQKQEQQAPAKTINPEEDIFGAFNQLMEQNKALSEKLEKTATETQAQFDTRALNEYVVSDATRFAGEKPDFQKALQHALMVQDKIEGRMGNTDPAERTKAVNDALRQIVTQSKKSGKSWAETVYNIALDYGYQPEAPAAQQDVSPEARDGIDRINRGQAAAVSMRHSGSGGVPEQLTLSKIASMDEREYLQVRRDYIAKNGMQQWNAFESGKRNY